MSPDGSRLAGLRSGLAQLAPWAPDGGELDQPLPSRPYVQVLRIEPVTASFMTAIGGVLLALAGYALLVPLVALVVLAVTWLLRGLPGSFAGYREAALRFQYIDGMIASHLAIGALILVTMVVVRRVHHLHPKWLSSVQPGFRWRFAIVSGLIALIGLNGVFWISRASDPPVWAPEQDFAWWLLVIVLTAPLQAAGEEFLFRGYLLQAAGSVGRSPWLAVAISAVIFTFMHGSQNVPLMVDRLGFGLLAGALVLLTGGLEAAIAAHVVNNVFAFGYAAAAGGIAQARTIQESTWQTTGWNLLAYGLVALGAWLAGKRMRVATRTPSLESGAKIR